MGNNNHQTQAERMHYGVSLRLGTNGEASWEVWYVACGHQFVGRQYVTQNTWEVKCAHCIRTIERKLKEGSL